MISFVFRALKRFAVLLPVLFVAYLSVYNIFPLFNEQLPILVSVILTYLLGAYLLVPAIIRLLRIAFPPSHLPHYCVTADGFASDPLNIGIIATHQQLIDVMKTIGWQPADKLNARSALQLFLSLIYKQGYPTAPMSRLYLFGRKQDLAFQLAINEDSIDSRHHVRFWATSLDDSNELATKHITWRYRSEQIRNKKLLWVGAASRDIGITFIRHNAQLTHLVDPDTDAERDLIVSSLQSMASAKLHKTITLSEPYTLINIHALRGHVNSDARLKIMELP